MSDEHSRPGGGRGDILAELEAEVAHELEEQRPPAGGPAYQVAAALVDTRHRRPGRGPRLRLRARVAAATRPGPVAVRHLDGRSSSCRSCCWSWVASSTDSEQFSRSSVLPLVGLVTFVGFAFLLPVIGFEIPALLLSIVWLRFLGGESWRSTIAVSVGTVAAFYALFLYGLGIPLPHLF